MAKDEVCEGRKPLSRRDRSSHRPTGKTTLTALHNHRLLAPRPAKGGRAMTGHQGRRQDVRLDRDPRSDGRPEPRRVRDEKSALRPHRLAPATPTYIKNMISGAAQRTAPVLGRVRGRRPMPQTREHILLAPPGQRAGHRRVHDKCDLVDDPRDPRPGRARGSGSPDQYEFPGDKTRSSRQRHQRPPKDINGEGANASGSWSRPWTSSSPSPSARSTSPPDGPSRTSLDHRARHGRHGPGRAARCQVGDECRIVGLRETRKTVVTGVEMSASSSIRPRPATTSGACSAASARTRSSAARSWPSRVITPAPEFRATIVALTKEEAGGTRVLQGYRPISTSDDRRHGPPSKLARQRRDGHAGDSVN